MDEKNIFVCFLVLFLRCKNNANVNVVTLTEINFPNALHFQFLQNPVALSD